MRESERRDYADLLVKKATEVQRIDLETVLRKDLGPGLTFDEFDDDLRRVQDICTRYIDADLTQVPGVIVQDAASEMDLLSGVLRTIQALNAVQFAKERKDINEARNEAAQKLKARLPDFFSSAAKA